jgi:hypothetical protein
MKTSGYSLFNLTEKENNPIKSASFDFEIIQSI